VPEDNTTRPKDVSDIANLNETRVSVDEGAEAFLELINTYGVEHIFLNPGSDVYPIEAALARFKALGKQTPKTVLCLDESVAMSAAHGHFMVSGQPQVVIVHTEIGTLQVGGALHNAQRDRIPVLLCAGMSPTIHADEIRGGRSGPHYWIQQQFNQAGIVRDYVKWHYTLQGNENIHRILHRAFRTATTEPCGPVYLVLPLEVLMEKIKQVKILPAERYLPVVTPQADDTKLTEAAGLLVQAEQPLIITGHSGRHVQSVDSLVELAETLGAPVISSSRWMNFPANHPLCAGIHPISAATAYVKNADTILVIDHDIPFVPSGDMPGPNTKVIFIDIDPVKKDIPLWNLPADILIEADSSRAIPALTEKIRSKMTPHQRSKSATRSAQLEKEHRKQREEWKALAISKAHSRPISAEWLCHCINEIIDRDTLVLSELITDEWSVARQIQRTQPGTLFGHSGFHLGWGLGAALGAKLAAPDRMVVSLMGDGGFVFGCPTASLWAATSCQAPFLSIIFNNQSYNAIRKMIQQRYGQERYAEELGAETAIDIKPSPDYSLIARGCHAFGEKVEEPADIIPALKKAIDKVKSGIPAVLDVIIEKS
jgi:acetolactate synthase-1/2/3 large subunit